MSSSATLHVASPAPRSAAAAPIAVFLLLWLSLVVALGAADAFVGPPDVPPLGLLAAVLGPVLLFLIAYRAFPAVRALALSADVRFITATQAWRFGGFAFLAFYAYGLLPGYFAWPAGLGDMAIAAAVPWMLEGLSRDPGFATSRRFLTWNVLGIVDLTVAVTVGSVVPLLSGDAGHLIPMDPMRRFPLLLVPALFVPAYVILHVIALAQARHSRS
jgi:hypothetical protein